MSLRRSTKQLNALSDLSDQVVQAYFISESGVILLRQLPRSKSYKYTFPNNTLFMDRLYFWGAIDPVDFKQEKNSHGPLEYATDPYIDLGGNGVVTTYSERVNLPNKRTGVVCVDVVLRGTETQIKDRLEALGGQLIERKFKSDEKKLQGEVPEAFSWVNNPLGGPAKSRITGAIAFESDFPKNPASTSDPEIVRFTVPIGSAVNDDQTTVTTLLLVTFDFGKQRYWIIGNSLGFALGIGLFVVVMGNLLLQYNSLRRAMNGVLGNMSEVMYEAATPFVWLNEKNEFVEANKSLLHKLRCDTPHQLVEYAPTFKDLVTADSLPVYKSILEQSARGEPTPPYEITIIRRDGKEIPVRVHGEAVPYPSLGRRRSPQRFGVFLPPPEVEQKERETDVNDSASAEMVGSDVKTLI